MKRLISGMLALGLALTLSFPAAALDSQETLELLELYYVNDIPPEVYQLDSPEEILEALGDPYTEYLSAQRYAAFMSSVNGQSLVGLGVIVQQEEDGSLRIQEVLPDSPAQVAGLEANDRILSIDGVKITAETNYLAMLAGEEDTSVILSVQREGETADYVVIRGAVSVPIVASELVDGVPVIECVSFGDSTAEAFYRALVEYADQPGAWVVDLRSNGGGSVEASVGAAAWFVGGNRMLVFFRDSDDQYSSLYSYSYVPDLTDRPAIILTSENTASGAELFSAALRDHEAAIAVGQRTFGKGVAQSLLDKESFPEYFDGDALKMTTSRFFSPNGSTNDTVGVIPTLVISDKNAPAAALLLAQGRPKTVKATLQIALAGQNFFVHLDMATKEEYREAFTELLEALPPSAVLATGNNTGNWNPTTPKKLAREYDLDFHSREYSDVTAEHPNAHAIQTLAALELLEGGRKFEPDKEVTRGEFFDMVGCALDMDRALMAKNGLINGDGRGMREDAPITYQEMCAALAKVAGWACMDGFDYNRILPGNEAVAISYPAFSPWARNAAYVLDQMEALDLTLDPKASATRGQAAQLLYDTLRASNLLWE